jgi:hypothetical protein
MAKNIKVFIDPSSEAFYNNALFNESDPLLNRDNCLSPFIYLKKYLESQGYETNTADYLMRREIEGDLNVYISIGIESNIKKLRRRKNVVMSSFYVLEPLVVAPSLYRSLKSFRKEFRHVFVHSPEILEKLCGVERNTLEKFCWPQTENSVIAEYWKNKDRKFLAMINANKKPMKNVGELYSRRIEAVRYFGEYGDIDLYGYGWGKCLLYWPYLRNRKVILSAYQGSVKSKYETLSKYRFAICYENMRLAGYITEKIFDCLFTGTVPVYLGAPDIESYIPADCYIDMRKFKDFGGLRDYLHWISEDEIEKFRENAKMYLESDAYRKFTKEDFSRVILKTIENDIKQEA